MGRGLFFATKSSKDAAQKRNGALPDLPVQPLSHGSASFDYFRAEVHHRHLVAAVKRDLAKGCCFVLITGTPSADGALIARFLHEEQPKGFRASLVRCHPGMDFNALVHAYTRQLGLDSKGESSGRWMLLSLVMLEVRNGVTRVLVIENADLLGTQTFDELLRFTQLDAPHLMPVVLLASPAFAERLEMSSLDFLRAAIGSHITVDRLSREEVGAFIQPKIAELGEAERILFDSETKAAIIEAANGEPGIAGSLARDSIASARGTFSGGKDSSERQASSRGSVAALTLVISPSEPQNVTQTSTCAGPPAANLADVQPRRSERVEVIATARRSAPTDEPHAAALAVLSHPRRQGRLWTRLSAAIAGCLFIAIPFGNAPHILDWISSPRRVTSTESSVMLRIALPAPTSEGVSRVATAAEESQHPATHPASTAPNVRLQVALEVDSRPKLAPVEEPGKAAELSANPAIVELTPAPEPSDPISLALVETPAAAANPPTAITANPASLELGSSAKNGAAASTPAAREEVGAAPGHTATDAPPAGLPPPAASAPALEVAKDATPSRGADDAPAAASERMAALDSTPATTFPGRAEQPTATEVMMMRRGDQLLAARDVFSARRFFERAATVGNAAAFCGIGKTFDPLFLRQIGTIGLSGDAATAIEWYRKAADAGNDEGRGRLLRLSAAYPKLSTQEKR